MLYPSIYIGAVASSSQESEGTLQYSLTKVNCNGTEPFLTNCVSKHSRVCVSAGFAAVVCQGKYKNL